MNTRVLPGLALAALALAFAVPAKSDVLWDQSALNENFGYYNSISGSPPFGLTYYTLSDITVPASGWQVQSITTTYSAIDPNWGLAITQGRLVVFSKTASLPLNTNNPGTGTVVPMSATFVSSSPNNHFVLTASGLNLPLVPGDYWIGITPNAPAGFFGPETQYGATIHLGNDTPTWNAFQSPTPSWAVSVAGGDGNILINGTPGLPTPVGHATWGAIKSLYR